MARTPRLTPKTVSVLSLVSESSGYGISGAEIMRATGLWSGTAYPMLIRLLEAGWLKAEWEIDDASKLGRPRKRLYRITGLGLSKLNEANLPETRTDGVPV